MRLGCSPRRGVFVWPSYSAVAVVVCVCGMLCGYLVLHYVLLHRLIYLAEGETDCAPNDGKVHPLLNEYMKNMSERILPVRCSYLPLSTPFLSISHAVPIATMRYEQLFDTVVLIAIHDTETL